MVDSCLFALAGNVRFSRLDVSSAYWQVNIKPVDQHKTAFHTRYGLFELIKMRFGLCNAPASYAELEDTACILDDVFIMVKSFDDHLENLDEALKRFRKFVLNI